MEAVTLPEPQEPPKTPEWAVIGKGYHGEMCIRDRLRRLPKMQAWTFMIRLRKASQSALRTLAGHT